MLLHEGLHFYAIICSTHPGTPSEVAYFTTMQLNVSGNHPLPHMITSQEGLFGNADNFYHLVEPHLGQYSYTLGAIVQTLVDS